MNKRIYFLLAAFIISSIQASESTSKNKQLIPRLEAAKVLKSLNKVRSAQFNPQGTQIVIASADKIADIHSSLDGKLYDYWHHTGGVNSAEFSPDGTKVVSASNDGTAEVHDAMTGDLLYVLRHSKEVNSAKFSPDGKWIATASADGTARTWMASNGNWRYILPVFKGDGFVYSADFSPDSTKLVTTSTDSTGQIWSVLNGRLLKVFPKYFNMEVKTTHFSPDGKQLIIASSKNDSALLVDVEDPNKPLQTFQLKGKDIHEHISSAKFSPDGTKIITTYNAAPAVIWGIDGSRLHVLKNSVLHPEYGILHSYDKIAEFNPKGTLVVTTSAEEESSHQEPRYEASVWNVNTGKLLAILTGHTGNINSIAFNPAGNMLATASDDKTTRIWDISALTN